MAKIVRKLMKMFGSTAGSNELAKFGSLAAAAPVYVNDGDPDTIQALPAWLGGWYDAVIGGNSPAIQDMNALLYVFAYQLCYGFQAGVPEYSATTTYYIGSLVNDGQGGLYRSLTDDNLGNALTSATNWLNVLAPQAALIAPGSRAIVAADAGRVFMVDSSAAAVTFTLPNPATLADGFQFTVKRALIAVATPSYIATVIDPFAAETIDGAAGNYSCENTLGAWTLKLYNSNWYVVSES